MRAMKSRCLISELALYRLVFTVGLVLLALLAGCATPTRIAGEGPAFERSGRFAVNVTEPGTAPEAVQGGFAWRDTGAVLLIDLTNPMGSTLARITVDRTGATLEHADGRTETAPNADALLAKAIGTALPVSDLRDWLQGRPGPGETQGMERDDQGQPASFFSRRVAIASFAL